jgi:hypothetical protein
MRHVHHLRYALAICLVTIALVLGGCPTADDDDTTSTDPWIAERSGMPKAALSIWGTSSDDVWVVGGTRPEGDTYSPPMLLHHSGGEWTEIDTGALGVGWWVVGVDDELIWVVGADGMVLRHDRAADTFTQVDTTTNATLFGAWVAPSGRLYAVGGVVSSSTEGSVLLQVDGDVATEVTLPTGMSNNESLFKVWGSDDDDVWAISDMGSVLHFDGAAWSRQVLPENPRLITIHGSGPEDLVVVGGMSRPSIFERSGIAWEDLSPAGGSPLNGVFVRAGDAFAAGANNFMMERIAGTWSIADGPLLTGATEWHGVWLDETGEPWVVGGNLTTQTDGIVARRETP